MKYIKIKSCHQCPYLDTNYYFDKKYRCKAHYESEDNKTNAKLDNIRKIPSWCLLENKK